MAAKPAFQLSVDTRDVTTAFDLTVPTFRENMGAAIDLTGQAVANDARQLVPVRTGNLKNFIASTFNARTLTARVGIKAGTVVGPRGRAVYPSVYGRFVHNGSIHNYPVPFMRDARNQEVEPYKARARDAGKQTERDLAAAYASRGGYNGAIASAGIGSGGLL